MRRRDFLKGLGVTAGAAAVAPHVLPGILEALQPAYPAPGYIVTKARAFIPFSVELVEDYPAFDAEVQRLLVDGYEELTGRHFAEGSFVLERGEHAGRPGLIGRLSPRAWATSIPGE